MITREEVEEYIRGVAEAAAFFGAPLKESDRLNMRQAISWAEQKIREKVSEDFKSYPGHGHVVHALDSEAVRDIEKEAWEAATLSTLKRKFHEQRINPRGAAQTEGDPGPDRGPLPQDL